MPDSAEYFFIPPSIMDRDEDGSLTWTDHATQTAYAFARDSLGAVLLDSMSDVLAGLDEEGFALVHRHGEGDSAGRSWCSNRIPVDIDLTQSGNDADPTIIDWRGHFVTESTESSKVRFMMILDVSQSDAFAERHELLRRRKPQLESDKDFVLQDEKASLFGALVAHQPTLKHLQESIADPTVTTGNYPAVRLSVKGYLRGSILTAMDEENIAACDKNAENTEYDATLTFYTSSAPGVFH